MATEIEAGGVRWRLQDGDLTAWFRASWLWASLVRGVNSICNTTAPVGAALAAYRASKEG